MTNYLYLYDADGDYPCTLIEKGSLMAPEDREAYIDMGPGHEPIRARIWMTSDLFQALPEGIRNGTALCGIKIGCPSNNLAVPTVDGTVFAEVKYAKQFRFVSARVARPGLNSALLEILLATEQNWWIYKPANHVFNVLSDDKKSFIAGATSSSAPKDYNAVVSSLVTDLGIATGSLPYTPTVNPFSLVLRRTPAGEALARMLRPLAVQLVCDPFGSDTDLSYHFVAYDYTDGTDTTKLTNLAKYNAYTGSGWYKDLIAGNVAPLSVDVLFSKWPPTETTGPTDTTVERYTVFNNTNPITSLGVSGSTASIYVGDHFDLTGKTYTETLSAIATERAQAYFARVNIPDEVWGFIGAYKFLPSSTIRRVRISIDMDGCYTLVYRHGRVDKPQEGWQPIWSTWHAPSRFPMFNEGLYYATSPRDDGTCDFWGALVEDCSTSAST